MRYLWILSCVLILSLASFGQDSGDTHQATVEGCLISINGTYSLMTPSGRLRVKGDHNTLFRYNGKQVQITGTVKSVKDASHKPHPQSIEATDIKKIADVCQ